MKKSLIAQILSILVLLIGAYTGFFNENIQAILGVVSFAVTVTLGTFMKSGSWVTGWSTTSWIVNIAGAIVQILNLMGEKDLISPLLLNQIVIGLNVLINYLGRDYTKVPT